MFRNSLISGNSSSSAPLFQGEGGANGFEWPKYAYERAFDIVGC